MRKNMLRLFTVIIVSFLIASMCIKNEKTFAEELETPVEDEDIDQYEYINNAYCSISISSGSATVSSEVYGYAIDHWHRVICVGWRKYTNSNDRYWRIVDNWYNTTNRYFMPGDASIFSITSFWVS